MSQEHEKAYVIKYESADLFFTKKTLFAHITDFYLNQNTRVRLLHNSNTGLDTYSLVTKTGSKAEWREENEEFITAKVANLLIPNASLIVKKHRYILNVNNPKGYSITLDMVSSPMKIAVVEIESDKPLEGAVDQECFGTSLFECPLSAWQFFRRKIGIFGGPSSGKSSCAQHLTLKLNTEFGANAFHVVEYATTFIQKYKQTPDFLSQMIMFLGQMQRERDAQNADIVISDCPTFLNYIYTTHLNKTALSFSSSLLLSKLYKKVLFDLLTYDNLIFMQLVDYKDNNVRYQTKDEAFQIQDKIKTFIRDHNVDCIEATYNDYDLIFNKIFYINF